jgi:hypothetical protein
MLGLCVVAVCGFGVVVVASAFAEGGPEGSAPGYYRCVKAKKEGKVYTGRYGEKECLTGASPANTGKYELETVKSGKFEGKSKKSTLTVHTTKGVAVTVVCKKDKSRGEIVGENEVVLETITFEDCVGNGSKSDPCGNVGPETIETNPQEGLLVWLNEAATEPGELLAGEHFAVFKCGGEEVVVDGFVVGTATLAGKKGPTITFALNGSKQQAVKTFWFAGFLGPFNLYTEPNAGEQLEATLESVEAQKGPAGIY